MNPAPSAEVAVLLDHYRKADDVVISHRAHVVLLHLKGLNVREITEATFKPDNLAPACSDLF